jgi:hypothetical protein
MQALKLGFARHIWQKRFYNFNVWTERKRIEKLRYMHRNPVQRGLAASPELWHWSSFRSRAYWRSLDFWVVIAGLLIVHLLVFIAVLRPYPQWRGIWFMPVVIVEGGLFGAILYPIVWQPQTPIAGTKDRRAIC